MSEFVSVPAIVVLVTQLCFGRKFFIDGIITKQGGDISPPLGNYFLSVRAALRHCVRISALYTIPYCLYVCS